MDPVKTADVLGMLLSAWKSGPVANDSLTNLTKVTPQQAEEYDGPDLSSPDVGFGAPLQGRYPVASGFGVNRGSHIHAGVDLGTPEGTPALAAISGTVTHAASDDPNGYGTWVEITGRDGISVRYGHLSQLKVKVGDQVGVGQLVALTGNTGRSTGPHLHFEVRRGGTAVDPSDYLSGATPVEPTEAPGHEHAEGEAPAADTGDVTLAKPAETAEDMFDLETMMQEDRMKPPEDVKLQGMDDFYAQVLNRVGAPVTGANLAFMRAWQRAEGGSPDNPFNTTQGAPGATVFNSHGVKRYPNQITGVTATVETLTNGLYKNIIAALKQGADPMAAARALAASPWGTGELVMKILGGGG